MASLYLSEILDACVTLLQSVTIGGGAPVIVQEGDLSFYPENHWSLTSELPAVFIKPVDVQIQIGAGEETYPDIGGGLVGTLQLLRVLVVDEWTHGDEVWDVRIAAAEAVAEAFIGTAPNNFNIGGSSISGVDYLQAWPTEVELEPPELDLISMDNDRRLFAVAVNVLCKSRSTR